MRIINVKHCSKADDEHRKSRRQYAHVRHRKDNIICVAKAFYKLPEKHKTGILLHELGHLLGATGELEADELIYKLYRINIQRKNTRYGKNLQTVGGS